MDQDGISNCKDVHISSWHKILHTNGVCPGDQTEDQYFAHRSKCFSWEFSVPFDKQGIERSDVNSQQAVHEPIAANKTNAARRSTRNMSRSSHGAQSHRNIQHIRTYLASTAFEFLALVRSKYQLDFDSLYGP